MLFFKLRKPSASSVGCFSLKKLANPGPKPESYMWRFFLADPPAPSSLPSFPLLPFCEIASSKKKKGGKMQQKPTDDFPPFFGFFICLIFRLFFWEMSHSHGRTYSTYLFLYFRVRTVCLSLWCEKGWIRKRRKKQA